MTGSPSSITLEQLMQDALTGNAAAYSAALTQATMLLRPYVFKRVRHKADMEDIIQDILLSVHKARHTYDGARPFAPWLFAIAHYRLQDYLRKHYADRLHHAHELSEVEPFLPQAVTEPTMTYESIREDINALPGKQPQILEMIHHDGYTAREVASRLDMKESAVKVAAHRAYKRLREKLAG